jgi:RNA-binding protein
MRTITSKQRAYLRSLAQKLDPIFHVGKNGVTPELVEAVSLALEARELIKINVLNNCDEDIQYICETVSARTNSLPVQILGKRITLYKENTKNPKITLPK